MLFSINSLCILTIHLFIILFLIFIIFITHLLAFILKLPLISITDLYRFIRKLFLIWNIMIMTIVFILKIYCTIFIALFLVLNRWISKGNIYMNRWMAHIFVIVIWNNYIIIIIIIILLFSNYYIIRLLYLKWLYFKYTMMRIIHVNVVNW